MGADATADKIFCRVSNDWPPPPGVTRRTVASSGLERVTEGVWTIARPFRALGVLEVGVRATILGLEDGGLLVHSPVPLERSDLDAIRALGPVRALVAPNLWHHLFFAAAVAAFPNAERWAAPGLARRRKDVSFTGAFGDADPVLPGIDWHVVGGSRLLGEVLLFHRLSRTLVVTDLFFNVRHRDDALARTYYRLSGAYGAFATSRLVRAAAWDRRAARDTAGWILDRDPARVTMAHGEVFDATPGALRSALRWVLE
jgi:hypothetical protein